jgi:hypothetical protein
VVRRAGVFMGDNGMNMGEHRLSDKQAPYEIEIPFYVSWPAKLGFATSQGARATSGSTSDRSLSPRRTRSS